MSPSAVLLIIAACMIGCHARVWNFEMPRPLNYTERSQQIIHYVNNIAHTTWRAGFNSRFKDEASIKRQLGVLELPSWANTSQIGKPSEEGRDHIPESFDARQRWPECPTIGEIRDQSNCGSCWAFGAVEAMSDRICIVSKGEYKPHLSAWDMMSCCDNCGWGCEGGYPTYAWRYFYEHGVVTGGTYDSKKGCMPYPFPKCEHHIKGPLPPCHGPMYKAPACHHKCEEDYHIPYYNDKFKSKSFYSVTGDVWRIQLEIMNNGPMEAAFLVYEDFMHYKSGVYQHTTGNLLGGHAVKILGWGVENKTPYWLVANSWNTDWGDKGYFKILRGYNECTIENHTYAGVPVL